MGLALPFPDAGRDRVLGTRRYAVRGKAVDTWKRESHLVFRVIVYGVQPQFSQQEGPLIQSFDR